MKLEPQIIECVRSLAARGLQGDPTSPIPSPARMVATGLQYAHNHIAKGVRIPTALGTVDLMRQNEVTQYCNVTPGAGLVYPALLMECHRHTPEYLCLVTIAQIGRDYVVPGTPVPVGNYTQLAAAEIFLPTTHISLCAPVYGSALGDWVDTTPTAEQVSKSIAEAAKELAEALRQAAEPAPAPKPREFVSKELPSDVECPVCGHAFPVAVCCDPTVNSPEIAPPVGCIGLCSRCAAVLYQAQENHWVQMSPQAIAELPPQDRSKLETMKQVAKKLQAHQQGNA